MSCGHIPRTLRREVHNANIDSDRHREPGNSLGALLSGAGSPGGGTDYSTGGGHRRRDESVA
jgi:hypothetical protein